MGAGLGWSSSRTGLFSPRSVNELGTGEPHTFQLGCLQWHPGAGSELLMERASSVLIRTSFQLPSAQAPEPLTGQPHVPPPLQLATYFLSLP